MEIQGLTNPVITPGQRLIGVKGFEAAEKYPTPRDSQVPLFDEDDDIVYVKVTDSNGGTTIRMFELVERPIPKFDPKKYVTTDDFNSFKEEILNGFKSLQQSITSGTVESTVNVGFDQQYDRANSEQSQLATNFQPVSFVK